MTRHIDKLFAADHRLQQQARAYVNALTNGSTQHAVASYLDDLRRAAEEFGRCMRAVTRGDAP